MYTVRVYTKLVDQPMIENFNTRNEAENFISEWHANKLLNMNIIKIEKNY